MALVVVNSQSNYHIDSAQYFDEPGVLTVLAIPVSQDECMFLPYPGPIGKMLDGEEVKVGEREDGEDQMAVDDDFIFGDHAVSRKSGLKGWWQKRRAQRWDRESKTDKFLKRIPSNVEHIRILYPTSIGEDSIRAQLEHQINKTQSRRSAKVLGLTAALPFALLLDLITFTFVFTIADAAMLVNHTRKLKKGKIVEDLMASNNLSFGVNPILEEFYAQVLQSEFKMPDNYQIDDLCNKLHCEDLIKTIRKVRNSKAHRQGVNLNVFDFHEQFDVVPVVNKKQRSSYSTLEDIPPQYRHDDEY